MSDERGQAAVEAALVLPIWLLVTLGAIQLALLQQSRLLVDYGAYASARAGSVWSGNNERMRDAALVAVLPSFGPTATLEALGRTYQEARDLDAKLHQEMQSSDRAARPFRGSPLGGLVRVDVLSPRSFPEDASTMLPELDFDSADTFANGDEHALSYERFLAGELDRSQDARRDATLLTVCVRFLYELKVPFANQALALASTASRVASSSKTAGCSSLADREFILKAADGRSSLGPSKRFFFAVTATRSFRMQSNLHRKWLSRSEDP